MTINDIRDELGLTCLQDSYGNCAVHDAYTSDLLSDVMAHAAEAEVLITIQAHRNTVAVASLSGASAIILCNSRPVPDDMIEAARTEKIALFVSEKNQFTVSGMIFALLSE